jgi:hypothetical protein
MRGREIASIEAHSNALQEVGGDIVTSLVLQGFSVEVMQVLDTSFFGLTFSYKGYPGVFRAAMLDYAEVRHHQAIPRPAQGVLPCISDIRVPEPLRRTALRLGTSMLDLWETGLSEAGFSTVLAERPSEDGPRWWAAKGYKDPRSGLFRFGAPDFLYKVLPAQTEWAL